MCAACCSVFLVFEYCAHDLGRLLDTMRKPFNEPEVKCLMQQVGDVSCTVAAIWILRMVCAAKSVLPCMCLHATASRQWCYLSMF